MHIMKQSDQAIGAVITDFDIKNPSALERIKELLYSNKVVVLKQQELSEQDFCDFSYVLGTPIPYLQENYHHPRFPLIFVSSNIKMDGQQIGVARTGRYWHSDTSFYVDPVPLTMLYPRVIPQNSRRTTMFIDMQKAYEAMPLQMQQRLASMQFIHSGKWRYKVRKEDAGYDLHEILQQIHTIQPPVVHPAVITHPVTGGKVLYGSSGFTVGIEGMGTDEANAFLAEVFSFCEQPRFITEFQWALGDVIIWDNRFLSHKAGIRADSNGSPNGSPAAEEDTLVYRITIQDGFALSALPGHSPGYRKPSTAIREANSQVLT